MKHSMLFLLIPFLLFSCSGKESESIISTQLKNKNVVDDETIQKSKSIQGDFEKDLDTLFQTYSGKTN